MTNTHNSISVLLFCQVRRTRNQFAPTKSADKTYYSGQGFNFFLPYEFIFVPTAVCKILQKNINFGMLKGGNVGKADAMIPV